MDSGRGWRKLSARPAWLDRRSGNGGHGHRLLPSRAGRHPRHSGTQQRTHATSVLRLHRHFLLSLRAAGDFGAGVR